MVKPTLEFGGREFVGGDEIFIARAPRKFKLSFSTCASMMLYRRSCLKFSPLKQVVAARRNLNCTLVWPNYSNELAIPRAMYSAEHLNYLMHLCDRTVSALGGERAGRFFVPQRSDSLILLNLHYDHGVPSEQMAQFIRGGCWVYELSHQNVPELAAKVSPSRPPNCYRLAKAYRKLPGELRGTSGYVRRALGFEMLEEVTQPGAVEFIDG